MPTICRNNLHPTMKGWQNDWGNRRRNHAFWDGNYVGYKCCIDINEIEKLTGNMPNKPLKMLLGWAALHQEELQENWYLARQKETLNGLKPSQVVGVVYKKAEESKCQKQQIKC